MKLLTSTWIEVEEYLKKSTGIIIPIGSTEQHGPLGLLGTDAITVETISDAISRKYNPLVGPTIPLGMAHYHMEFPGTITLRPNTLIHVVNDVITSLSKHGFTHIYFINGHGGNSSTIETAFHEYYSNYSMYKIPNNPYPKCKLCNFWEYQTYKDIVIKYFGNAEGIHATPGEISISDYAYPQYSHKEKIKPEIASPFVSNYDSINFRENYPDGRIGSNSALATKEAGKEIVSAVSDEIWHEYLEFLRS